MHPSHANSERRKRKGEREDRRGGQKGRKGRKGSSDGEREQAKETPLIGDESHKHPPVSRDTGACVPTRKGREPRTQGACLPTQEGRIAQTPGYKNLQLGGQVEWIAKEQQETESKIAK